MKREKELNKRLEEELNKQFPKGDKARGRALVLFAIAKQEINKAGEHQKKEIITKLRSFWIGKGRTNIIFKDELKNLIDEIDENE